MEEYLKKDYGCIEDTQHLKSVEDIKGYFTDAAYDAIDCGQGYYEEYAEFICKIEDRFYSVIVHANIESSKQDRGDRLYFIDSIENVSYEEIEKPLPKEKNNILYNVLVSEEQNNKIINLFKELGVDYFKKED